MVKLKGPILSLGGAGTIGDTLTTQDWKGRTYMRKKPVPAQPQSGKQVGMRAMFSYLSQHWKTLSNADQVTWYPPAARANVMPFNAYMNQNLLAWATGLRPFETFPRGAPGPVATPTILSSTPGERHVVISYIAPGGVAGQGLIFYLSRSTGFTPGLETAVKVVPYPTPGVAEVTLTDLESGTWYLKMDLFDDTGTAGSASLEDSFVIP